MDITTMQINRDEIIQTQPAYDDLIAGWQKVNLGEVVDIFDKQRVPLNEQQRQDMKGSYPYCGANGILDYLSDYLFDGEYILLAEDGGYWGALKASAYLMRGKFWVNNHAHILKAKQGIVENAYLVHHLNYLDIEPFISGSTRGKLNQGVMQKIQVLLPPLPEQCAIVKVLQTAQEAISTRQDELKLERERKAALMEYLFTYGMGDDTTPAKKTKFGSIPLTWKIMPLEQCAFVQTGIAKGRKLSGKNVLNLPYLRVANVQDGYLDLSEIKNIELLNTEVERYKLQTGDVVVTEGGDFDKLGRGFLWKGQIPNCVHQNHIFAVRVNQTMLLPEYFAYLIQSNYGKTYFLTVAHRTTHLASINSTKLKAFPTLIPSLSEQKGIVDIIDACDAKITSLEQESTLLQELFRAFLEELMSGRLSTLPLIEEGKTDE